MGEGKLENPPDQLTEKWLMDFPNFDRQPESVDSGIEIPDSIFDLGGGIAVG